MIMSCFCEIEMVAVMNSGSFCSPEALHVLVLRANSS
jgi:hypothetical protein